MARRDRGYFPSGDFVRDIDRLGYQENNASLYITNIPDGLDAFGLEELFSQYGKVRCVRILPRTSDTYTSVGFVNYENVQEALRAIWKLDRIEPYFLNVRMSRTTERQKTSVPEYYEDEDEYLEYYDSTTWDESEDESEEELPHNFKTHDIKICVNRDGRRDITVQEPLSERPEFRNYRKQQRQTSGKQFSSIEPKNAEENSLNGNPQQPANKTHNDSIRQSRSGHQGPAVINAAVQTSNDNSANNHDQIMSRPSQVLRTENSAFEHNAENNVSQRNIRATSRNRELNLETSRPPSNAESVSGRSRQAHLGRSHQSQAEQNVSRNRSSNEESRCDRNRASGAEANFGKSRSTNVESNFDRNRPTNADTNFDKNRMPNSNANVGRSRLPSAETNVDKNRPSYSETNVGRKRPPNAGSNFDRNRPPNSDSNLGNSQAPSADLNFDKTRAPNSNFGRSHQPNTGSHFNKNRSSSDSNFGRNRPVNTQSNFNKNRPSNAENFNQSAEKNWSSTEDLAPEVTGVVNSQNHTTHKNKSSSEPDSEQQAAIPVVNSLQLKLGQEVNVIVSQIDSLDDIWVQIFENIHGATSDIEQIQAAIKDDEQLPVSDFRPVYGGTYRVQYPSDQAWYRGKIIEVNSDNTYRVLYIDYGNCENAIKREQIKPLSMSSLIFRSQAIKCKTTAGLKNKYKSAGKFSKSVLGDIMHLKVVDMDFGYPIIDLKHAKTEKSDATTSGESTNQRNPEITGKNDGNKTNASPSPPSKSTGLELIQRSHPCVSTKISNENCVSVITYLEKDDEILLQWTEPAPRLRFWAQLLSNKFAEQYKTLVDLHNQCGEKEMSTDELLSVKKGDIVAAKSSDGIYYRAVIVGEANNGFEVFFIDYGNKELVTDLKHLSDEKKTIPSIVVSCTVSEGISKIKLQKCLSENSLIVTEKTANGLTAVFKDKSDSTSITIESWHKQIAMGTIREKEEETKLVNMTGSAKGEKVDDTKIVIKRNQQIPENEVPKSTLTARVIVDLLPEVQPLESDLLTVSIVHVASYKEICVQIEKNLPIATKLFSSLNTPVQIEKNLPITTKLLNSLNTTVRGEIGHLVCAKSSDLCWYRAEILKMLDTEAEVLFIDYGNTEKVTLANMKQIPAEAMKIEKLALTVALGHEPETIEPLTRLTNSRLVDMKIINGNATPKLVEFFRDGEPIFPPPLQREKIVPNVRIVKRVENMTCSSLPLGKVDLVITFIQSPEMIFCLKNSAEDIGLLTELGNVAQKYLADAPQNPYDPQIGEVCMALFGEDGSWYRSVCLDKSDDGYLVFFLDFGNTDRVKALNIRPINDELYEYPTMIKHCRLLDYKDKEFDDKDTERIKAMLQEATSHKFEVTGIEKGDCLQHKYWISRL